MVKAGIVDVIKITLFFITIEMLYLVSIVMQRLTKGNKIKEEGEFIYE